MDGVEFLTSTRQDWAGCLLGGHINWHLTLYHLGKEGGVAGKEVHDNVTLALHSPRVGANYNYHVNTKRVTSAQR